MHISSMQLEFNPNWTAKKFNTPSFDQQYSITRSTVIVQDVMRELRGRKCGRKESIRR